MFYHWHIVPSKQMNTWTCGVYAAALLACFMNTLTGVIQSLLALWVGWMGIGYIKNNTPWQLFYSLDDGWHVALDNQAKQNIAILPSTVITRHIIFLHYVCNEKKCYKLIAKTALLPHLNDYRQLLVTLKTDA